ncbi:MAG: nucleotidyltransferase family protein [Ruminococcus sp.]|nr:nucleotidyltransferase family protein [Ruminococcus sp.]
MEQFSKKQLENFSYLISLLSAAINETEPQKPSENISFKYIYSLANAHEILNTVFYSIEKLKINSDNELFKKWKDKRNEAFHRNMIQTAEFELIKNEFTKNGVEFLPVKGIPLCELYPQSDYRFMNDLDILVKDTKKAGAVIKTLGYSPKQVGETHHDEFIKPPFMLVELHRDLVRADSRFFDYYSDIFSRANKINEAEFELSREDFYIYSVVHIYKHYSKAGTGLRSFTDLYLLNKKWLSSLNTAYVEGELKKLGLSEFREKMSKIADKWFLHNDYKSFSDEELFILTSGAFGTTENKVNAVKGNKGKLAFVFKRLFPSPKTMKWRFPWLKKYPLLLPYAYLYRILRDGIKKREDAKAELSALNTKRS